LANIATETVGLFRVVTASYTEDIGFYPVLAPASATMPWGVTSYLEIPATQTAVLFRGTTTVIIAADSAAVSAGDWVITSDTEPGAVMKASVAGDLPLSLEESQRRVGRALTDGAYNDVLTATTTLIILGR
jgi:hypothetical protein